MSFSVVVTNWNRTDVLPTAVQSILAQQGIDELEIIIVDDASEDDSLEKAVKLKRRHPETIRLFETHESLTHSFVLPANIGMKRAKHPYVVLNPSDTIQLSPANFKEHLRLLRADPNVLSFPHLYNLSDWRYSKHSLAGCCTLKNHVFKLKGWDERMYGWGCDDIDFGERIGMIGVRHAYGECNAYVLHVDLKLRSEVARRAVNHYNDEISAQNQRSRTYAPNETWGEHPKLEEIT